MTPEFTTIRGWCDLSGMSRSGTYKALSAGAIRAIKVGNKTLIDVAPSLVWLKSMPPATFRQPGKIAA